VLFADTLDQAGLLVRDTPDIDQHIVLRNASPDLKSNYQSDKPIHSVHVEVKSFTFIN